MKSPLLSCRGLEAGYGASQVLFGLDFDIHAGEVVALATVREAELRRCWARCA